jgi:hypothetical protein
MCIQICPTGALKLITVPIEHAGQDAEGGTNA